MRRKRVDSALSAQFADLAPNPIRNAAGSLLGRAVSAFTESPRDGGSMGPPPPSRPKAVLEQAMETEPALTDRGQQT